MKPDDLAALREPFPPDVVRTLPKAGGIDYVPHAEVTARLLDTLGPFEIAPLTDSNGRPCVDDHGGVWLRLTLDGTTVVEYGHNANPDPGDAMKASYSDALKRAAMRFGVALDMWRTDEAIAASVPVADRVVPIAQAKRELLDAVGGNREEATRLWAGRDSITRGDLDALMGYENPPSSGGGTPPTSEGAGAEQQGEEGSVRGDDADPPDPGRPFTKDET